nr:TRAP transporter substrate-binding protein [Candidatus Calescibacterium sp.]
MSQKVLVVVCATLLMCNLLLIDFPVLAQAIKLKYAHMHTPESVCGRQAEMLAKLIEEKTGGAVKVEIYPTSQLGNLQEMAEMVSTGAIAIHHNTMAAIGSLCEPFAAFDTPYLYKSVDHLLKATDPYSSPIMQELNQELIKTRGVRVLYTFYFGTRQLTCNRPIYKPEDLKGVKIRSIPFPIYTTAVEGLGAIAVPIDWAEVPTALATGIVSGQENPVEIILSAKLYEVQKYLMLTGHIMGAEVVVFNEETWQKLSPSIQEKIIEAAKEVSSAATKMMLEAEAQAIQTLKERGMTVIGPEDGLDIESFRKSVTKLVQERFREKFKPIYEAIEKIDP